MISQIPQNIYLQVNNSNIIPITFSKNLGIFFYLHSTSDTHTNKISSKVFSTIMNVNRIQENFSKKTRVTVVQSLVLSLTVVQSPNELWNK